MCHCAAHQTWGGGPACACLSFADAVPPSIPLCSNLRAETSIALAEMAGGGGGSGGSKAANQRDALEEARLAGEAGLAFHSCCAAELARGACSVRLQASHHVLHPPELASGACAARLQASHPLLCPPASIRISASPLPAPPCRPAVEQIVIPQLQPVELLPRDADTIDLQVQLVRGCGLPYEVVGSPTSLRLRVLPPAWAATPGAAAEAAAPAIEGAKQKEYW